MNARERRRAIMDVLEVAKEPVSGSALAREVGVSRQIVVQDIALLRADGHDVVATNRGYVLQEAPSSPAVPTRLVKVRHSVEQAGDELTSIVDAGGAVLNVIVNHRVYGKITADLDIRNRRDVERYLHDIESGKSFPLLTVTSGYHFHRIAAEDEQTLDEIETKLKDQKADNLRTYRAEITDLLNDDIILRHNYYEGVVEHNLVADSTVIRAVELLGDRARYDKILTEQDSERN